MYLTYSFRTDDWAWTKYIHKAMFKPPDYWVKNRKHIGPFLKFAEMLKFDIVPRQDMPTQHEDETEDEE